MGAAPLSADLAKVDDKDSDTSGKSCCHAHSIYTVGQSELKGEDVVFVEHRRAWPGSETTEHSTLSTSTSGGGTGDIDSDLIGSRWAPVDFPPSCSQCGAVTNTYSLYCVFDGHNGVHAAKLAGESVLQIVESRLPLGNPPPQDHEYYKEFCEGIQMALVEAIVEMNRLFAQLGIHAGCTATVVLQQGWLVTSAALGDSRVILDTGYETISLSVDHRVASHKAERRRVEAMGGIVAPLAMCGSGPADDYTSGVGPLRIWPGGLSISRAIGDFDVGDSVLPYPHVTQVLLPPTGGRLLIGSDGIWDAFDKMSRAGSMSRTWSNESVPSRMISTIVRAFGGLKDDTSLIVADILPFGTTFPQVVQNAKKGGTLLLPTGSGIGSLMNNTGSGLQGIAALAIDTKVTSKARGGGFCLCFGGSATVDDIQSTRSGNGVDLSVRSYGSHGSSSVRGGKPRIDILCSIDVAGAMGLMPEPELIIPGWYSPEVGEKLFRSAAIAADSWRIAHEKRYARPPPTPPIPEIELPRRKGRKTVAFSQATEEYEATREDKPTSGMRTSASQFFPGSTSDDTQDFASKFGHYKGGVGGQNLADPSVRAGRVYNSDASVRAGNSLSRTIPEDPSVHIRGSSLDGSLHYKASEGRSGPSNTNKSLPGLAPVRVVKRAGSSNTNNNSVPMTVPSIRKGAEPIDTYDSVNEHMLKLPANPELTTIGE